MQCNELLTIETNGDFWKYVESGEFGGTRWSDHEYAPKEGTRAAKSITQVWEP